MVGNGAGDFGVGDAGRLRYWRRGSHNCLMLGFFDEAGDPGLKVGSGSNRFFVEGDCQSKGWLLAEDGRRTIEGPFGASPIPLLLWHGAGELSRGGEAGIPRLRSE